LYDVDARPLLVSILERLREDVGRYWARLRVIHKRSGEDNHTQLLDYVRTKDADAAARWLSEHLGRVRDELVSLIEEKNPDDQNP
ncbi:MAG: FCD domain-containing protein, partial [Actinomycetota bacterium]